MLSCHLFSSLFFIFLIFSFCNIAANTHLFFFCERFSLLEIIKSYSNPFIGISHERFYHIRGDIIVIGNSLHIFIKIISHISGAILDHIRKLTDNRCSHFSRKFRNGCYCIYTGPDRIFYGFCSIISIFFGCCYMRTCTTTIIRSREFISIHFISSHCLMGNKRGYSRFRNLILCCQCFPKSISFIDTSYRKHTCNNVLFF